MGDRFRHVHRSPDRELQSAESSESPPTPMRCFRRLAGALPAAAPGGFDDPPIFQPDEKPAERPGGAENINLFPQREFPAAHPAVLQELFHIRLIDFRRMLFCLSETALVLRQGTERTDTLPKFRIPAGHPG